MKNKIFILISSGLKHLGYTPVDFSVDTPPQESLGDYSSNVALMAAKQKSIPPYHLAQQLAAYIFEQKDYQQFARVEAVKPGFLNFTLSQKTLLGELGAVLKKQDKYGQQNLGKKKKVLVEYFQPNIAKPLHIGHMRTAVIGDAILRMLKAVGYRVESDTHMGDWGTQFGLLISAYKRWGNEKDIVSDPISILNQFYIRINAEIEKDPKQKELGKQEFVKLEQGDKNNRKIWKKFVNWSMEKFLQINKLLDITEFDHHWPESFYEDKMPRVLELLQKKQLLQKSQGAQIVNLEKYGLGVVVIVKSDGGTTYLLRDLATYLFRKHDKKFLEQLYVVDVRQQHTFQQLFKILELLGEWKAGEGEHLAYGFMSLPDGALSTRKGHVIELERLVEETNIKARKIIAEKNFDLENADQVARDVAIGALKYFDLSHNRHSNIVFEWDKVLDFNGNTGPYLQYTHARIKSILRKAGKLGQAGKPVFASKEEQQLLRKIVKYPETLATAANTYLPNLLTDYLYALAWEFNGFYQKIRVLDEADKLKRGSRLLLIAAVAQVLKNGLELLGIKAPEEM